MSQRDVSGAGGILTDLVGGLLPLSVRKLQNEVRERLRKIPNRINEFGYDPYGLSPEWIERAALPMVALYRWYFRVETFDIDRLPAGAMLLVANHAGQLPFDGAMLSGALLLEADQHTRVDRVLVVDAPAELQIARARARDGSPLATLEAALELAQGIAEIDGIDELVVIGGAEIYAAALPLAQRMYLTEVHAEVTGGMSGSSNAYSTSSIVTESGNDVGNASDEIGSSFVPSS